MTYDYKRLCDELLSYLYQCDWPDGERFYALTERARTALVEPGPPNLKEKALDAAQRFYAKGHGDCTDEEIKDDFDTIRRALQKLPND